MDKKFILYAYKIKYLDILYASSDRQDSTYLFIVIFFAFFHLRFKRTVRSAHLNCLDRLFRAVS